MNNITELTTTIDIKNVSKSNFSNDLHLKEKIDLIELRYENDLHEALAIFGKDNIEEFIPSHVVKKLANGENPLKTWREYRKMTIEELANKSNIGVAQLTSFEINGLSQTEKLLPIIATALNLDAEDFIWNNH
jgi:hypothetical protein